MRRIVSFIAAGTLVLGFGVGLVGQAEAAIAVQPMAMESPLIQVYGGCGLTGHRGPYGGCRPGGQLGGYVPGRACPRGFHLGPYGRRCRPNF